MNADNSDGPQSAKQSPTSRIQRGTKVGGVVARHVARAVADSAAAPFRSDTAASAARDRSILRLADDIATTAAGMRGAAHKLGQLLASLDLGIASPTTRAEFARRLEPLFAAGPRWNDAAMLRALDELGPARSRLSNITGPIASASIGQVYRGRLDNERDVAIKIKYPDIDRMVRADLKNMRLLVKVIARHLSVANAQTLAAEVAQQISAEIDFRTERENQREFSRHYADHPAWRIPDVIDDLCTDRMLVTEYLAGQPFTDLVSTDAAQRDRAGEIIYRFYCGEMYRLGRFCADPHPGNILALPDGRLGFVDFGLCITLSPEQLQVEREVFSALLLDDHDAVYRLAHQAGFISEPDVLTRDQLVSYIDKAVGWHIAPGRKTITRDYASEAAVAAILPSGATARSMQAQQLIEAHAFGRRNDLSTCSLLGRLEATADWSAIARECLGLSGPATALGEQIAAWANPAS